MAVKIPTGISDFREVREGNYTYVDKSLLIRDLIEDSAKVILIPRPRRFGKTLNLSMLRTFFEKTDTPAWPLFADLQIANEGEAYRRHCQRYPVVFLSFKDIKRENWEGCLAAVVELLANLHHEHRYLLSHLEPDEASVFTAFLERRATEAQCSLALGTLCRQLHKYHGERPLILLDEYDSPLHAAHTKGYYEPAVTFFRNLLSSGLKDNPHLHKGILTGILRVAKDSIFTGLNNLEVYTVTSLEYATQFGFTEVEVVQLLQQAALEKRLPEVQAWYNGYRFGGEVIYNPWSVLSFVKRRGHPLGIYWGETSSNEVIREILVDQGMGLLPEMEQLLRGEEIHRPIVEQVALREVRESPGLIWSFLLMSGYLKLSDHRWVDDEVVGTLSIPNREVLSIYRSLFRSWMDRSVGGDQRREDLLRALLLGDAQRARRHLAHWLLSCSSVFDTAAYDPPERFYHGFVLGVLVGLGSRYEVLSNRESGYGRCDILIAPKTAGQPGCVLEFKVRDRSQGETVSEALDRAALQVRERGYAASLFSRGANPVYEMVFVFDGKDVYAQGLQEPSPTH